MGTHSAGLSIGDRLDANGMKLFLLDVHKTYNHSCSRRGHEDSSPLRVFDQLEILFGLDQKDQFPNDHQLQGSAYWRMQ